MATAKKTPAADAAPDATPDAPEQVLLRCEDLGETRPFTPAHAKALLAYQDGRGLSGDGTWQPVDAAAAPTDHA